MPSTGSLVMTHLISRPRQHLFASANWQSPVCSINSPCGRELYPRPLAWTTNTMGNPGTKRLRDILPLHMAQIRSVHMVRRRLRSFCVTVGLHYNKWSHSHCVAVATAVASCKSKSAAAASCEHFQLVAAKKIADTAAQCERT